MKTPAPVVALSARDRHRERVVFLSTAATRAGIRVGMSVAAARALCAALVVLREDPLGDARTLERLAAALLRFTPDVCLDGPVALALEVGRTAHHFGGEHALAETIRAFCATLGFTAISGIDDTPEAARVRARERVLGGDAEGEVEAIPWRALAPSEEVAAACTALGLRTIGELLKLPRSGLATRTSLAFVQQLQRMRGELDEPLVRIVPPERFDEEIDFLDPVAEVAPLLFAAKRLLDTAEAMLEGRGHGITSVTITLVPVGRESPRTIELAPSEPTHSARLLLRLLGHRLERERFTAPIEQVKLSFDRTVPLQPAQEALFEENRRRDHEHDLAVLCDRLAVRLGRERVSRVELVADHRPERAFRLRRHGEGTESAAVAPVAAGPRPFEVEPMPRPLRIDVDALGRPIHLHAGGNLHALQVVRGPERIASGWWDGHDIERAYFEVETDGGARLWLFRDLKSGAFFLHGAFS